MNAATSPLNSVRPMSFQALNQPDTDYNIPSVGSSYSTYTSTFQPSPETFALLSDTIGNTSRNVSNNSNISASPKKGGDDDDNTSKK